MVLNGIKSLDERHDSCGRTALIYLSSNHQVDCVMNCPVLKAESSDKAADGYTVISRDDGSKQSAYKCEPLYTFAKDQKSGDVLRDGLLNGAWDIAKP